MWLTLHYGLSDKFSFCSLCGKKLPLGSEFTKYCSECGACSTGEDGLVKSDLIQLEEILNNLNSDDLEDVLEDVKRLLLEK